LISPPLPPSFVVQQQKYGQEHLAVEGVEMGDESGSTEYAIKRVGDRYYPVIIDREAGGHYEIKNPLTGGILSYNNPEAAETYIKRARENEQK
jgi:hypothetical protein